MDTKPEEKHSAAQPSDAAKTVETQLSLVDIINMILTFWWLIVVLAFLIGAGTYAYSRFTSVAKYKSSGTIYINTQQETKTYDVNTNAILGAKTLMPTYVEVLQSTPFLQTVSDDIDNKYSYSEIKSRMNISSIEDTNLVTIDITTSDAHDSFLICNSIVNNAPDEVVRIFEGGSVKVVNIPEEPTAPERSEAFKRGIIGALIGAALAILLIFLMNLFDTRVKSSEDLGRYKLPILGEVPNWHEM